MTVKGVLAGVLLAMMGGAWWWTLSRPAFRPSATATAPAEPPARPFSGAPPEVALHRLRRGAAAPDAPTRRDPFAGGVGLSPAIRRSAPAPDMTGAAPGHTPGMAPSAGPPRLELIGIATRAAGDPTRVAVLAGEQGIVHATAGDTVAGVYRIDRVHDDAVDLVVMPEGRAITLRLK